MAETKKNIQKTIETLDKQIKEAKEDLSELTKSQGDFIRLKEKEVEIEELIIKQLGEKVKLHRELGLDTKDERSDLLQHQKLQENINKQLKEHVELQEEISGLSKSFADDLSKSLGIITDLNESGLGQTYNLFKKSDGVLKGINNAAEHLSKNLLPRIGISMLEKAQELFVAGFHQLDEVGASLARNIPRGREYQGMIEKVAASSGQAYLNFEDARKCS